jgi:hypothetical protein
MACGLDHKYVKYELCNTSFRSTCVKKHIQLTWDYDVTIFYSKIINKYFLFGPKRKEEGSWRKLHNDELHNL